MPSLAPTLVLLQRNPSSSTIEQHNILIFRTPPFTNTRVLSKLLPSTRPSEHSMPSNSALFTSLAAC